MILPLTSPFFFCQTTKACYIYERHSTTVKVSTPLQREFTHLYLEEDLFSLPSWLARYVCVCVCAHAFVPLFFKSRVCLFCEQTLHFCSLYLVALGVVVYLYTHFLLLLLLSMLSLLSLQNKNTSSHLKRSNSLWHLALMFSLYLDILSG